MGMTPTIDVTIEQRETILSLLKRHLPGTAAWAYGSRVTQKSRLTSDLDLVVFASPNQVHQVSDLREASEESDLPFRVDLFVWKEVPESFRRRIEVERVVLVEKQQRNTGPDWSTVYLRDCIEINTSTYSPKEEWPFVNYLDTSSITENRISKIQYLTVGEDKIPSRARRKVQLGEIVYSTVRPNQKHFGLLRDISENFLVSTGFVVIRGKENIACTDFIYWFLTQEHIVELLHTIAEHSTTAYPSIRPSDIEGLKIDLPPLPEQRAIAQVLGVLDNKIELNRRMNETLEAMVHALFKFWFVDFEPVHAKAEGHDTGLPDHIANFFSDRLVDSELGEIPEGWSIYCLDELAEQHALSVTPSNHPETVFEHFSIPAYDRKRIPAIDRGGEIKSNKTVVPSDAVLLSKLNPEIPRVWIPGGSDGGQQICSTEFLVFVARKPASRPLLFCLFASVAFGEILQSMVTGTSKSHQRVPTAALKRRKVIVGTPALFGRFGELVGPMLERISENRVEIQTLTALRDALLPKLFSGELRIDQAIERLENAT